MNKIYNIGFCMIFSCSLFLNAELPSDMAKIEHFDAVFNTNEKTEEYAIASEEEFDLKWVGEYVNFRNAVALYVPLRTLINPLIVNKCLNKEYAQTRPLKLLPITRAEAICLPVNAVTYIAGVKFLDKNYPLKKIMTEVAISSVEQISESALNFAAYKYLPQWSHGFFLSLAIQQLTEQPINLLRKKLNELHNKSAIDYLDKDKQ